MRSYKLFKEELDQTPPEMKEIVENLQSLMKMYFNQNSEEHLEALKHRDISSAIDKTIEDLNKRKRSLTLNDPYAIGYQKAMDVGAEASKAHTKTYWALDRGDKKTADEMAEIAQEKTQVFWTLIDRLE